MLVSLDKFHSLFHLVVVISLMVLWFHILRILGDGLAFEALLLRANLILRAKSIINTVA